MTMALGKGILFFIDRGVSDIKKVQHPKDAIPVVPS